MSETAVTVRVLRPGDRAERLLGELFQRLGADGQEPDERGMVVIRLPARGPQAWEQVRDALDAGGPEWRQWLHLEPRPKR